MTKSKKNIYLKNYTITNLNYLYKIPLKYINFYLFLEHHILSKIVNYWTYIIFKKILKLNCVYIFGSLISNLFLRFKKKFIFILYQTQKKTRCSLLLFYTKPIGLNTLKSSHECIIIHSFM